MKRILIPKVTEIHLGYSDYGRRWGLTILWGWNDPKIYPAMWRQWNHHVNMVVDPEAYHQFGRAFKRLLPRISHG